MAAPIASRSAPSWQNLQADLADSADRVDQLLFELMLQRPITGDLDQTKHDVEELFGDAPDITAQRFRCGGGLAGLAIFDQGLINQELFVLGVLEPLVKSDLSSADSGSADLLDGSASPSPRRARPPRVGP